ncbi:oxysterol-binding protein-related protein 2A-like isoform X2 [Papaver somniferum]|nr:oxysterol-binding protein-related protein 2A-like isoform X2 [Papaver somniferum]
MKMRVKELHPLCCITLENTGGMERGGGEGDDNESPDNNNDISTSSSRSRSRRRSKRNLLVDSSTTSPTTSTSVVVSSSSGGSEDNVRSVLGNNVAGVLYKWTNFGKGWRCRWFMLRNGVLSYSKIPRSEINLTNLLPLTSTTTASSSSSDHHHHNSSNNHDIRVIGDLSSARLSRLDSGGGSGSGRSRKQQNKTVGFVHLQISSFRVSKSDDRKFYIFTATKTLYLRTDSKKDRVAWINALASSRSLFNSRPLNDDKLSRIRKDMSISTVKLRDRLLQDGINEVLVNDCEQIMLSEFSELQGQLRVLCDERTNLLDTLRQLEAANIEVEASGIHDSHYQLAKHGFTGSGHGKSSECSTTESSDDIEKQVLEEASDEDETSFFDTRDSFGDSSIICVEARVKPENHFDIVEKMHTGTDSNKNQYPLIERRDKLPFPIEKEKAVSLWSIIKDNVGKDLTRVCLPVYFNEPISSLQKCFEDLEYSYLLDRAYEHGKNGNSLLRIVNVAAFAVSGYASSEGRHCKPFNPLLGETYEADYPEKGVRFFSEKVSHHPTLIACHCEGRGWKFWGDSNLRTKFWGRSIQLDPVGVLTLEFDDGEIFQWSKVTTSIYNLILGKVYCDHHGTMEIRGNRELSCKLKFKEQSLLDRNPHQVQGSVEDTNGNKLATLFGKWDDSMYYLNADDAAKTKCVNTSPNAKLLWKSNKPLNHTRYNLTSFAITLNELTPGLQEKLPPTDSRLRPDQRHLENGEYEKANAEKLRLETRQRMSRKLQENGWKPRWFEKESEGGPFRYVGGYWEAREQSKWDGCADIFTDFTEPCQEESSL